MRLSDTENTIINAMARAFYVSAWADKQEERGRTFPAQELMELAPSTPKFAREFALMFAGRLHEANGRSLLVLLNDASLFDVLKETGKTKIEINELGLVADMQDDEYVPDFGHYLAMEALGHGVSWFDDHAKFDLKIPHVEFYL